MNYAAVYFDLDGTLLGPDGEIPDVVRGAIARVKARGIRIGIATGRRATTAVPYATAIGVDAPCILFNGARVVDADLTTTLSSASLPLAPARQIVGRVLAAGIHVVAYVGERLLVDVRSPRAAVPVGALARSSHDVVDLASLAAPPTKLLFVHEDARLDALRSQLQTEAQRLLPAGAHLVRSGPRFLELLPDGVHKGHGLRTCAARLGIDPAAIVAIGDDENDREMLTTAGLGLAMGHAPAPVRAAARRIVGGAVRDDGEALAAALDDIFDN